MKILITGTAGFIGFHLTKKLLDEGHEIIGLDCINEYYDVKLKQGRLLETGIDPKATEFNRYLKSSSFPGYTFIRLNLEDKVSLFELFKREKFEKVINLAAQAGVRYSLENPQSYIDSNISGFLNILEACRYHGVKHLIFASSSSVYGLNEKMPFSTQHNVDHPISIYAATKKSNELMAHAYSFLFNLPTTGLRFFTVYGPWGRPDMALFLFTKAILNGQPIDLFNRGDMLRDFTYVDDIVNGISRIKDKNPVADATWNGMEPDPSRSKAPYHIYNIGNNKPVKLLDFIEAIENTLGIKAKKNLLPMQAGDVPATFANVDGLVYDFNYKPNTSYQEGIRRFVEWYRSYYKI
jgi:UDP-glucuronate 4-epimerase